MWKCFIYLKIYKKNIQEWRITDRFTSNMIMMLHLQNPFFLVNPVLTSVNITTAGVPHIKSRGHSPGRKNRSNIVIRTRNFSSTAGPAAERMVSVAVVCRCCVAKKNTASTRRQYSRGYWKVAAEIPFFPTTHHDDGGKAAPANSERWRRRQQQQPAACATEWEKIINIYESEENVYRNSFYYYPPVAMNGEGYVEGKKK